MVGILVAFWDGLFSGAMLVSGSVHVFFENDKFFLTAPITNLVIPESPRQRLKTTKCLGSTRNPETVTTGIIYILSSRWQTRPSLFTVLGGGVDLKSC